MVQQTDSFRLQPGKHSDNCVCANEVTSMQNSHNWNAEVF